MIPNVKYRKQIEQERDYETRRYCLAPEESDSEGVFLCSILCGTNPKPICYGEYPHCMLQYRGSK